MKFFIKIFIILFLSIIACDQEKLPLPVPQSQSTTFGASDTNYVELSPVWNSATLSYQFNDPADILIGQDGLIFIADKDNDKIVCMTKAGEIQTRNGLGNIHVESPLGIGIDSKLNLVIANGTNTLYGWNQYINYAEIDSIAYRANLLNTETNETAIMSFDEYLNAVYNGENFWQLVSLIFESVDPSFDLDVIKSVSEFYTDENPDVKFSDVTAGDYGSNTLYATDYGTNRIIKLELVPDFAIKSNGFIVLHYKAIYTGDVATYGSGAGTVDYPWSITSDDDGDIYFTQLGGNFKVQKLVAGDFSPQYILYQHDIMDLQRFDAPFDIALDDLNNIFVIDNQQKFVTKFANTGANAGNQVSLGKKGLATAEFDDAKAVMVQENVVYVLESGKNQIRRFQYSVSDSDVPDDDKKP